MNDTGMIFKKKFEQAKAFWQDKFPGEVNEVKLPPDIETGPGYKESGYDIVFPQTLSAKLLQLSKNQDVLLYVVLLSALKVFLCEYLDNGDVTVASPVSLVKDEHDEEISGKLIPFRDVLNDEMSFKDVLKAVKQTVVLGYENQHYVIENILEVLGVHIPSNLYTRIIFLLENIHQREMINDVIHSPGNDITISITRTGAGLVGNAQYNANRYKQDTVKTFCDHYLYILEQVMEDVNVKLREINMLREEERERIINHFNATGVDIPPEKSIHEFFREQVEKCTHQIAVKEENHQITYRELNKRTRELAGRMWKKGHKANELVALLLESNLEAVTGILGVLEAGGAYLPIDAALPGNRIEYMLKESHVNLLVTTDRQANRVKRYEGRREQEKPGIISLDAVEFTRHSTYPGPSHSTVHGPGLAYAIYTSGTTGTPKCIAVQHRGLVNYTLWRLRTYRYTANDVTLQMLPYCFDGFGSNLYSSLLSGGTLLMIPDDKKLEPEFIKESIKRARVTNMSLVPTMYRMILYNAEKGDLKSLRFVVLAGEKSSIDLVKASKEKAPGIILANEYGPSETTVTAAAHWGMREFDTSVIGQPIANTRIYILNQSLKPVLEKIPGELCVAGEGIARGYLNNPGLTAGKFIENPLKKGETIYRTGDLARWQPDGKLELLGRIDRQIKIRGFRIELGEIENQLARHGAIKESVVIVKKDKEGDPFLCAYIETGSQLSISKLKEYLAGKLPDYMIPSYFIRLEKFPLTPNGKIDRRSLPEPRILLEEVYAAPRDEVEEKLAGIWSGVLGLEKEKISIDANFFEMGGHSLKATMIISRIHKNLEVKIPLMEIFKTPTIRGLSGYIKRTVPDKYAAIEPVEKREYYAASSAQKRLYILQMMAPASTAYNMPELITTAVEPDPLEIEQTFKKLIRRHESTRTSFQMVNDELVQVIYDETKFAIKWEEKEKAANDSPDRTRETIREFIRPFDLSRAPLLRVGLVPQPGKGYLILVDMHHIITDGVSRAILGQDFFSLEGGDTLAPLRLQYKDYARWQINESRRESIRKQKSYWISQFEGEIPVLNLPTDYPRPALQVFEGSHIISAINPQDSELLRKYSIGEGITLYMILLAAVNILLSKLGGEEDIIVGTPVAGRRHGDIEKIIGMFVNSLALRNFPGGKQTSGEFLNQVKERTLEAFENQEYPFEDLVGQVDVNRDVSRNPIFDIMFIFQDIERDPGSPTAEFSDILQPAKFDMTFTAVAAPEELLVSIEYCTKLYKKETIQRLLIYFEKIISLLVQTPGIKLSQIEIIGEEEKSLLLYDFNRTGAEYPADKTIHELFAEQVKRTPDNAALVGLGADVEDPRQRSAAPAAAIFHIQVTYRELKEAVETRARQLGKKGIQPGDIVGIIMERSIEMITGIFAILTAGGAYLPIDPKYPQERIDYMLRDSGASLVLASTGVRDKKKVKAGANRPRPADLAYVIYTSGTSGKPKGTAIEHHSLINRLNWMQKAYPLTAEDTIMQKTTFTFDVSVWEIFWWSFVGARLYLLKPGGEKDPALIQATVEKHRVTHMHFVPSMLSIFLEHLEENGHPGGNSLKQVIASGEALTVSQVKQFNALLRKEKSTRLVNLYGPTEATIDVTYYNCGPEELITVPIGKPIDNIQLLIVDKYLKVQPVGIPGELFIGGAGLARGYLNRPELTAEKFDYDIWDYMDDRDQRKKTPGKRNDRFYRSNKSYRSYIFYKTGDLARWLTDGNIEFIGRKDHQVKVRGFRVELGEIETQLTKYEAIKNAVVVLEDAHLWAYIAASPGFDISRLRGYLSGKLPDYMIPSAFFQVEKIPLTSNGKVDRKSLRLNVKRLEPGTAYAAPENETQKKIMDIWRQVLKLEKIGINDNYFELGGTSFDILKINKRLKEVFQEEIPIPVMFRFTTVNAMEKYLNNETGEIRDRAKELNQGKMDKMQRLQKRRAGRKR